MKKLRVTLIALMLGLGSMIAFSSCNDDDDCPNKTYNSFEDCEDATDGKKCTCVPDDGGWRAVLNP